MAASRASISSLDDQVNSLEEELMGISDVDQEEDTGEPRKEMVESNEKRNPHSAEENLSDMVEDRHCVLVGEAVLGAHRLVSW